MDLALLAGAAAGYSSACYVHDVLLLPALYARKARQVANALGKPVLNVGCGTPRSSLRAFLLGVPLYGDVNVDIEAAAPCDGSPSPCRADVNALPFPDKFFGAAIASHVLEHVEDPSWAVMELLRVAEYVVIIVPKWWAPHTWAHPGHRWFIDQRGRMTPLWT